MPVPRAPGEVGHMLDDVTISRAIIRSFMDELDRALEVDVAIVGAGPAGMTAGYYLARGGSPAGLLTTMMNG